jgi:predicted nucleic acid-binding protein
MPPDAVRWAYFDTSVLVKRYVREPGSVRAQALFRRYGFLSSAVVPVELLSALHRRRATGELSLPGFEVILARIKRDRAYWALIEVSSTVLDRAERVISQTGVRTLDAIHLASALHARAAAGASEIPIPFVTADVPQREAALRLGLDVQWIG